jgi:hypothetical protein
MTQGPSGDPMPCREGVQALTRPEKLWVFGVARLARMRRLTREL